MTTLTQAPPAPASPRTSFGAMARAVDGPFLVLGAASRLPAAMLPLGLLLYVASATGSYATGGLAVAALSVGGAVGGPLVGVAADRLGQRPVVLVATVVQVAGLAALLALGGSAALPVLLALAAAVGTSNPQAGAMSRSRWAAIASGRADRRSFSGTAMAWEGAVDESSFVVGPVLVGTLAGLVDPAAGLVLALAVAALAQTGFALHPSALPGRSPARAGHSAYRPSLPWTRLGGVLLAMVAIGVVFGSTQTGVAARLSLQGSEGLTGPVYALLGVGSAVTGLLTTRLPHRVALEARIAVAGGLMVVAGALVALAGQPVMLGAACLLLGAALAPALVSAYALAEQIAPRGWTTTTMTALGTANVSGVAAGAALAGQLVDRVSPAAALLLVVGAGLVVALAGLLTRRCSAI